MAVEDMEKTAFLTQCGVYCYTCMPFGLRNVGATFQRLMHITLGPQLGKNVEAYVDNIVVKSREARTLIQDLEETFASLNAVNLRLNPEKCVFGVPSGKLLGFLVTHRGIEANPEKVKALEDYGLTVSERVAIDIAPREANRRYLDTKRSKFGHLLSMAGEKKE
mgnify:CR=1 FL=1